MTMSGWPVVGSVNVPPWPAGTSLEDPIRIAGARDYRPGDPLKRMHWKATARTGELQVRLVDPSTTALARHGQVHAQHHERKRADRQVDVEHPPPGKVVD